MYLWRLRQALTVLVLLGFGVALSLVMAGRLQVFQVRADDALTPALYLVSTIVQAAAALLGIIVALLFITAQYVFKPGHSRLLRAIFWDATSALVFCSLLGTLSFGLIVLDAGLCVGVLACIVARTGQLPDDARRTFEAELPERLKVAYDTALGQARENPDWLPGDVDEDPWRGS